MACIVLEIRAHTQRSDLMVVGGEGKHQEQLVS